MRLGFSATVGAIFFTALFAAAVTIRAAGSAPTVKIDTGKLEGKSDGTITAFLGIPFAKPPVGDLRWKPPVAPARWKGTRKATEFGARCMQGRIYDDMIFRDPGPSEVPNAGVKPWEGQSQVMVDLEPSQVRPPSERNR